jgi:hypothetical protein
MLGYDKLTPIHSEWIKYIFDSEETVVLQAHRNAYKTTAMVVGVIRQLFFYPDTTILIMRKSYTDAQKILQEIQQHYEREPLRQLYNQFKITEPRGDKWKADVLTLSTKKSVSKEGNVECLGIDSSLTGAHYDKIILDDIITIEDRISRVTREKTKIRLAEMVNIPKRPHGTISVTGTPWHPDDGYATLPKAKQYSIYDLDPPILSEKEIQDIRERMPASLFSANYELRHIADQERYFTDPNFDWCPEFDNVIGFLDPAYRGTNYTALTILGQFAGKKYVNGWAWRRDVIENAEIIVDCLRQFKVNHLYIESNADKGLSIKYFREHFAGIHYEEHKETINKHFRILNHIKPIWRELNFHPKIQPEYLNQIIDYQENQEPDDAPDSLAGAILKFNSGSGIYILGNLM